jgi:predicted nucleic acid-binding protein
MGARDVSAGGGHVYVETSAILRDLLDGDGAPEIRETLRRAEIVVTSRLTLAEVRRVLARLRVLQPAASAAIAAREAQLESEADLWTIQPVDEPIFARCGRPFPKEPVRTLDAIHLATVERVSGALPRLVVLSTDDRVRTNAAAAGFDVKP